MSWLGRSACGANRGCLLLVALIAIASIAASCGGDEADPDGGRGDGAPEASADSPATPMYDGPMDAGTDAATDSALVPDGADAADAPAVVDAAIMADTTADSGMPAPDVVAADLPPDVSPIGAQCMPVDGGAAGPPALVNSDFSGGRVGWLGLYEFQNPIQQDDSLHGGTAVTAGNEGVRQVVRADLATFSSIRVRVDLKMSVPDLPSGLPTAHVVIHAGCAPSYDQVLIGRHVFQSGPIASIQTPVRPNTPVFVDNPALNGSSIAPMSTWVSFTSDDFKPLLPPDTQFIRVQVTSTPTGWVRFDNIRLVLDDEAVPEVGFVVSPAGGESPVMAHFEGSCSDPGGSCVASWWDFGDSPPFEGGSVATGNIVDFTFWRPEMYNSHRTPYDVSFTVEDDKGAAKTFVRSIDLTYRRIVASLTANPASGPAPLTVQFTGSATGTYGMVSYEWDFGDGSKSTEMNPSHTFNASGSYQVRLSVWDEIRMGNTASTIIVVQ
jgi:hypothetical protein